MFCQATQSVFFQTPNITCLFYIVALDICFSMASWRHSFWWHMSPVISPFLGCNVYSNPCNGLLESLYGWVVYVIPYKYTNNRFFSHCSPGCGNISRTSFSLKHMRNLTTSSVRFFGRKWSEKKNQQQKIWDSFQVPAKQVLFFWCSLIPRPQPSQPSHPTTCKVPIQCILDAGT